jgi:DNA mismatch repair protein MSH3
LKSKTEEKKNTSPTDEKPTKKKRRARETSVESDENQNDKPLFPPGFTNDLKRHAHEPLSPSSPKSNSTDDNPPLKKKPKSSGKGLLSRFEFQDSSTNDDDAQAMEIDTPHININRREQFLKKFGSTDSNSKEAAEDTGRSKTRSRRRIIESESEEEESKDAEDNVALSLESFKAPASQGSQASRRPSKPTRSSNSQKNKSILTPLEKQYVEIKDQYPDAILCIEVGYKFRFFGEDAEVKIKKERKKTVNSD